MVVDEAESRSGVRSRGKLWKEMLGPALVLTRREVKDSLRDWRIIVPILLLVTVFPFLANFAAARGLAFVNQYGARLLMERLFPFLMLVVGFFPSTFSLVIALETFVGEKERRSLEPLLATPFTDLQLYIGKLLASTIPPVLASYFGMVFYVLLLGFTVNWWPTFSLFAVGVVLATAQALVMVSAAVIVSAQSTSVRAANLLASFIIIPMAFLLQAEAALLLMGHYGSLWLLALALVVVNVLLLRMGVTVFNREHLLGREVDRIDFKGAWRTFWQAFWPRRGLGSLYLREIPGLIRAIGPEILFTLLVVFGGGVFVGVWGAAQFPLPLEVMDLSVLGDLESLEQAVETAGILPKFSTLAIFSNNVRSLILGGLLALFSLGTLAELLLLAPVAIIAYIAMLVPRLGIDPWGMLVAGVLPHGVFELSAAVLATAQAMRMGVIILRSPEKGGGVLGIVRELGHFVKLFIFLVLPFLLAAAWIEAEISTRLTIGFLSGL
ncbi:MAG: stage II sporulation protein M [Anaerolineae bacterium]|nr:stage II sporulation protein M [Anaerolineae bacterium]